MFAPNYTQIPNELLDHWLPKLSETETKLILVIMRKTFGWHKIRDRISLSQLEKLTGKNRQAIWKATKNLQEIGLITKTVVGKRGAQQTFYELVVIDKYIEVSNNSYQGDVHPVTRVINTPTKETPTKEKNLSPPICPPLPLFTRGDVSMPQVDHDDLVAKFGVVDVDYTIEQLSLYAKIDPDKFKKYKSHASVVQAWILKERKKEEKWKAKQTKQQPKSTNSKPDSSVNASRELQFTTLDSIVETPKKSPNGSKETKEC